VNATATLVLYCGLAGGASLVGGWLAGRTKLTHTRMELVMSFVSGLMLGVALFHMLPDGAERMHSMHDAGYWVAAGVISMFLLIRVFHVHAHGEAGTDCGHAPHDHGHRASGAGVLAGLTIHSLLDGVALAAAVAAGASGSGNAMLLGLGTFLAVFLHKPLDSLSIVSVMAAGGWTARSRNLANIGYALTVPLGAGIFHFGLAAVGDGAIGAALCFSAGLFLCIALADLLPEIQFHQHDRLKLTSALLAGIALAYVVGLLHVHEHDEEHEHDHSGHDHSEHGNSEGGHSGTSPHSSESSG
jgi:zinc and cadmium transporter